MASLHTLNSADIAQWHCCRATLTPGDSVLLIEDGANLFSIIQAELPQAVQLFCLYADTNSVSLTCPAAQIMDYAQWVKMACLHQRNISW